MSTPKLNFPLLGTGLLAAGALTALLACSCGETPTGPEATTPAGERFMGNGRGNEPTVTELGGPQDTLVIGFQSDADILMSVVYQSASDSHVMSAIFADTYNASMDCELTYEPYLADSWEFSEDGTQIEMKLRDDLEWADGKPITAHDVAFTYELIRDPNVASPRLTYTEYMAADSPQVVSDFKLLWTFTRAYDQITMTAHTGMAPVPKHRLTDADRSTLRGHPLVREPLFSGPFKIDQWLPNEKIVLVPNEKFTGPEHMKARLKRVILKILPEYATRLVELENGSTDVMEAILVADADRLRREHPEIELYRRGWRSMDYVAWNHFDPVDYKAKKAHPRNDQDWKPVKPHPVFRDNALRRALAKAVNVDKLIADLLTSETGEVYARRSVSTITPALCNVHDNDIQPIGFDPQAAKAELEAAGWVDTNGDGYREKDGEPLAWTLMTNSGNARRAKGAIIIQALLKDIGARIEIETVESNTFFERLRKKDYESALSGWSAGLFVDMSTMWKSGEAYEFNFPSYTNPEVDALIDQALAEPDPAKNSLLWKQVQAQIYEDQPYMFLYWMDEIVGVNSRFKDAKVDILSPFHELSTWWVPEDEVKYAR